MHVYAHNDMTREASVSRIYGAILYRSDCEMGITTGNKVGSYTVAPSEFEKIYYYKTGKAWRVLLSVAKLLNGQLSYSK